MKKAIYAGSFDPPHLGHAQIINEASKMFDELIVVVSQNVDKKPFLSQDDRVNMLKDLIKLDDLENVKIDYLKSGFLVDYAIKMNADYFVRGLRSATDFEYERNLDKINHSLTSYCNILTIYLMAHSDVSHISSSLIRSLIKIDGGIDKIWPFVPGCVECYIKRKL